MLTLLKSKFSTSFEISVVAKIEAAIGMTMAEIKKWIKCNTENTQKEEMRVIVFEVSPASYLSNSGFRSKDVP